MHIWFYFLKQTLMKAIKNAPSFLNWSMDYSFFCGIGNNPANIEREKSGKLSPKAGEKREVGPKSGRKAGS